MVDVIYHHEDWQTEGFVSFIAHEWERWQGTTIPPQKSRGAVKAAVNQGRWIVTCPNECGDAVIGSRAVHLYICAMCGSTDNGGLWYEVIYPKAKRAIEAVLLKRPAHTAFHAKSRNWLIHETVADLEKENADMGLG